MPVKTSKNFILFITIACAIAILPPCAFGGVVTPTKQSAAPIRSHNAYDYFVAAGKLARESNRDAQVERAGGWTPESGSPHKYTLAEKMAILKANEPALSLARQGFPYPFTPPSGTNPPNDQARNIPGFASFRHLARLLRFEAQVRAERGDWAGAMESDLDAIQLGEMSAHGGDVITKLVGEAVVGIGRVGMWDITPHLNAAQAKHAAARLDEIEKHREPLANVMRTEKSSSRLMLESMLTEIEKQKKKYSKREFQEQGVNIDAVNPARLRLAQTRAMDYDIAIASKPYDLRSKDIADADPSGLIYIPSGTKLKFRDTLSIAEAELLRATLGLQVYHEKFGRYPASLTLLTPSILAKAPIDPFARDAPLRYRLQNGGYLLYSVGPDTKDDGGAPIKNEAAKTDKAKALVLQNSPGDIIAGVNKN
ncbi:MAG: hypothetical protein ABIY70_20085 [Capsulimonas sp.]|uniref:hypothetical protein n=1 Tax=Capsulimonas sp. TaxID=2494211 RepID=UPI00326784E7